MEQRRLGVEQIFLEQAQALVSLGEILPGGLEAFSARLLEAAQNRAPLQVRVRLGHHLTHLHLGHTVVLRKLRILQDMGHSAHLVFNTPPENLSDTLRSQIGKVVDLRRITLLNESAETTPTWDLEVVSLSASEKEALSTNIQAEPSSAKLYLAMPLLEDRFGTNKMSTRRPEGCIFVDDPPDVLYEKLMEIPNQLIASYESLLTPITLPQLKEQLDLLSKPPEEGGLNVIDIKAHFSKWLVSQYYSQEDGEAAETAYFKKHGAHLA